MITEAPFRRFGRKKLITHRPTLFCCSGKLYRPNHGNFIDRTINFIEHPQTGQQQDRAILQRGLKAKLTGVEELPLSLFLRLVFLVLVLVLVLILVLVLVLVLALVLV